MLSDGVYYASSTWDFTVYKIGDGSGEAVLDPSIAVSSALNFVYMYPKPDVSSPPSYTWHLDDIPEGDADGCGCMEQGAARWRLCCSQKAG
ncbi:MAG: hypothetical protein DRN99_09095 [Thermoproteota archaeon]|nr:MAG: hypothetical protein DRN99_09095 [Candidatus Korarchaeota archaeon]